MSTYSLAHDEAMRVLVTAIRKELIGQNAAVTAFAEEIWRHIALSPLHRRPAIFLIAGANSNDDHRGLPSGLAGTFRTAGGLYELGSGQGEDLAHIFSPISGGPGVCSLMDAVKDNPSALFVLRNIDKGHPRLLANLMTVWNWGFVDDGSGGRISLADAVFVLTTEVAQEEIGQIARSVSDPARLHVECLKLLVDAGFSASLLKSVDTVFALKALTPGEAVLEHYRSFADQIAAHGLALEEGGIDGRILAHSVDSSLEPDIEDTWLPRDELDVRFAQAKAAGAHTVRLVLAEEMIKVILVGELSAQEATSPSADAPPTASPDEEAKGE